MYITDVLIRAVKPTVAPTLPPEVTHVWVMSEWQAGCGFRWDPQLGWAEFANDAARPGADDLTDCTCAPA